MAAHYRIRNWKRFQHYNKPRPAWIKLHRSLLDDPDFQSLYARSRALLVMLWLVAAESNDGTLPSAKSLSWRLRLPLREVETDIKSLSNYLEDIYTDSRVALASDREETEKETETYPPTPKGGLEFDKFWSSYPRKVGKAAARRAWDRSVKNGDASKIDDALRWQVRCEQWTRDGGQYIPNPATYLNQARWLDENPVMAQAPAIKTKRPEDWTEEEREQINRYC